MIEKKQKLVPEIRFKGFTEDWEQRKFEDYYKMCSGYAFKYQNYVNNGVPIVNGESIQHGKVDSVKINYLPENFRKNYSDFLLYEGDIVVGLNRPITEGNLKIARIPSNLDKSLLYQRAGKIKFLAEIDADFSYILLQKQILKHTLREAVGSDQPFISTSKLDKWMMMIPKSREEKIKIGLLFKNLDNLITLHQRKQQLLKQLKQAYLQQMFPQNGEKVPRLRFVNFNEEWEQCELGEVINLRSGRDYKHLAEGEIPVYGTGGYMLSVNEALSYKEDAIGIGRKGTIDRPYILKAPFWTVDTLFYALSKTNNDLDFIFNIFQNINWKQRDESTGVPSLSKTTINEVNILIPVFQEQKIIGNFFQYLDQLITLHQKKIDSLKKIKSIYLKSMFI